MEPFLVGLALVLGVKHAFDADHVVAVGTILTRAASVAQATRLSLWWSLGHLTTAGLLTTGLVLARDAFWPQLAARLELLVPILLVAVGAVGLLGAARRLHYHRHPHGAHAHAHLHLHLDERHEARKLGGIGVVHGLASNDELLVILTATLGAGTLPAALGLVAVFSAGVVLGMVAYAAAVHYAVAPARRPVAAAWSTVVFSLLSVAYGAWLWAGGASLHLFSATP